MTEEEKAIEEFENVWPMMTLWASAFFAGSVTNKTLKKFAQEIWLAAFRKYGKEVEE